MSKEKDYIDKIEVHRQEVELDEVSRRRTRTRSSQKQNKAPKSPMIKILVVIFILIPLGLLGYVWLFYEPEVKTTAPEIDNSIVHIEKNNSPATSANIDEENDDDGDKNDENQNSSNDVEVDEEEEQAIAKAAAEAEKKLKEQQKKEDEEENEQSSNPSNAKTHVVEAKDTLYSIAMKYYKDPTKVDAIKKANNLSSDSIPLGKELILP